MSLSPSHKLPVGAGLPRKNNEGAHALGRSAARNARAAGVAEGVIMKMSGWKTRSVFDRYAIVAEDDMDDATRRIQRRRAQFGHNSQDDDAQGKKENEG